MTAIRKVCAIPGILDEGTKPPTSHALRRSLGGEMHHHDSAPGEVLSEVLGHVPEATYGRSKVTMHHYIPAPADLSRLAEAFAHTDHLIRKEIGSLFVRTDVDHAWGHNNPIRERCEQAIELFAKNWEPLDNSIPRVLNSVDAAAYLGISPSGLNNQLRGGRVPGAYRKSTNGSVWWIPIDALEAIKAEQEMTRTTGQIASELGIAPIEVWRAIKSGKLPATRTGNGAFHVAEADLDLLRAQTAKKRLIESRSVNLRRTAQMLEITPKTAKALIDSGQLERDESPTDNGWIYVTVASIEQHADRRDRRIPGRRVDRTDLIEISDVAQRTGRTRAELEVLARSGYLRRVDLSSKTYLKMNDALRQLLQENSLGH